MDTAVIAADPHHAARQAITVVAGTPTQNLIAHFSATPGAIRWPGRRLDADGENIRANRWSDNAVTDADPS